LFALNGLTAADGPDRAQRDAHYPTQLRSLEYLSRHLLNRCATPHLGEDRADRKTGAIPAPHSLLSLRGT